MDKTTAEKIDTLINLFGNALLNYERGEGRLEDIAQHRRNLSEALTTPPAKPATVSELEALHAHVFGDRATKMSIGERIRDIIDTATNPIPDHLKLGSCTGYLEKQGTGFSCQNCGKHKAHHFDGRIEITPAKPQGEAREWVAREARAEHFRDVAAPEAMYTWDILPEHHKIRWFNFADRILAQVQPTEASQVPPESHITQVARLASMLPTSEEADNAASEVISQFEKGVGKPLPVPEVTPEAPTCPVCLVCGFSCNNCGVDLTEHLSSLFDKKPLHDVAALFGSFQMAVNALESIGKNSCCTSCQEAKLVAEGALKAVSFARQAKAPQPTDRLLEAAKAVVEWYTSEPKKEWNPHMEDLLIQINAIEAFDK